jgi:hypothetical protein
LFQQATAVVVGDWLRDQPVLNGENSYRYFDLTPAIEPSEG